MKVEVERRLTSTHKPNNQIAVAITNGVHCNRLSGPALRWQKCSTRREHQQCAGSHLELVTAVGVSCSERTLEKVESQWIANSDEGIGVGGLRAEVEASFSVLQLEGEGKGVAPAEGGGRAVAMESVLDGGWRVEDVDFE